MYMTKQLSMNLEFTFSVLLHDIYFDNHNCVFYST